VNIVYLHVGSTSKDIKERLLILGLDVFDHALCLYAISLVYRAMHATTTVIGIRYPATARHLSFAETNQISQDYVQMCHHNMQQETSIWNSAKK